MIRIYTAGPMGKSRIYDDPASGFVPHGRSNLAPWRTALVDRVTTIAKMDALPGDVGWSHPEELTRRDHCGGSYSGEVVEADLGAVESADLVAAYLDGPERYGTLVEIGVALGRGIPVVLVERCTKTVPAHVEDICACSQPELGRYWFGRMAVAQSMGCLARVVVSRERALPVLVLAELVAAFIRRSKPVGLRLLGVRA